MVFLLKEEQMTTYNVYQVYSSAVGTIEIAVGFDNESGCTLCGH